MKKFFIRIFGFILSPFEKGDGPYSYKASSRYILLVVGVLFGGLSGGSLYFFTLWGNGKKGGGEK